MTRTITVLMGAVVLLAGLAAGALGAGASIGAPAHADSLGRDLDPVVVTGSLMPGFAGAPLDQLFVYRYNDGTWSQIPWQFDEVRDGKIVSPEDGLLDADDQLAFMAADAGDRAPAGAWLPDASSSAFPRYELAVSDPLDPTGRAWTYVFRSTTLAEVVTADYVSYDAGLALLTSDRYMLGLMMNHPVFNRLELNGSGVNILDRTKIRVKFQYFTQVQTEEALTTSPPVATRDGRVRVVIGGGDVVAYRALFVNSLMVDLTSYPLPPEWGRMSVDLSPAASGSLYFDPNVPAGVVVDGSPDAVPASPAADWSQVSGATGSFVRVLDFSAAGGAATTYYKDDATTDSSDTGDKKSYGDAGVRIDGLGRKFLFTNWNYVLPASRPNVGAAYKGYAANPLHVEAAEQLDPNRPTATPTPTATATATSTPTPTPTPTSTPTATPTATPEPLKIYLPLLLRLP